MEKVRVFHLSCQPGATDAEALISDDRGEERFRLIVEPASPCDKGQTLGWVVRMYQAGKVKSHDNLLRPTRDPDQDYFTGFDFPGFFLITPPKVTAQSGLIPLSDVRVVSIDRFDCSLEAIDYTLAKDRRGLTSITVRISFENKK